MKKFFSCLSSFLIAFFFSLFGVAWQTAAPASTPRLFLFLLSLLPIPLLLINLLLAKRYIKKIQNAKVADMQAYMLSHRAEAAHAAKVLLRRLQWRRRAAAVYAVFLFCLAVCISLFSGMMYSTLIYVHYVYIIYAGCVFYAVFSRIHKQRPDALTGGALALSPADYPQLYGAAERAAQAIGCRGKIVLRLSLDCNASIVCIKNHYFLQLGILLLGILSEEELYAVLLHEFSHCSKKNRAAKRELKYGNWVASGKDVYAILGFVTNLFVYADVRYLFDHMTYEYATSITSETEADRDMARYSDSAVAASALLKIHYDEKLRWETTAKDELPLYAAEEQNPHYLRDRIAHFRCKIDERHAAWDAMVAQEILPNNATHPTLKMRLQALGVSEPCCVPEQSAPAYRAEIARAVAFLDGILLDSDEDYQKAREAYYLAPLSRITAWEEGGMPLAAESYADIIADLKQLGRYSDAEALCDRAIQELDENSSLHAYFIKGSMLLFRYDAAGIALLYHAIENNFNYLDEGMGLIGQFCCMTGREEDLRVFRERAKELAQRDKDEYRETGFLAKGDRLTRDEMPSAMKEEILSYILSLDTGIIRRIYLVRKTVNDSFFTSAFVIHFYGGTEEMREEIMHKIFSYLDSYPVEWQFSLFDYFECKNIRFDKIEGCLIYEKPNRKGE